MLEGLFASIGGIKCDNKSCDFNDMKVKVEDYDKWLNKPCPKCSSNLLTQSDYDAVQTMLKFAKLVSPDSKEVTEAEGKISFSLNGTEKMGVTVIDQTGENPEVLMKDTINNEQFQKVMEKMKDTE